MSAGDNNGAGPALTANSDLMLLAPKFRAAVQQALARCAALGMDAYVYEAYRSQEMQALYYARGRTVIPPTQVVTNASSNLYSWHGYGLAVDVISGSKGWDQPDSWFKAVADCFGQFGCRWGGEWVMKDLPHFQWGRCKPSPSDVARQLIATEGMSAVWEAVGAA
jgi:hypothetical protein